MWCHQEGRNGLSKYIVMLLTFCRTLAITLTVILVSGLGVAAGSDSSPVGLWKTFGDGNRSARGTVRISENDGTYSGKIESSSKPEELTERCDKCPGDRKNEPIIGLNIMRGVKKNGSEYDGGEILDPETGYVYKCKFTLSADGQKLYLRGYLGFSMFGRTQIWERVGD